MTRIIDCSMIVSNQIWRSVWKVDISTRKGEVKTVEGDQMQGCSSILHLSAHCGSHIDSPLHVIPGGR